MNTSSRWHCQPHSHRYRRWFYPVLTVVFAAGSMVTTPQPVRADLFDLIFESIRVIQLANLSDEQEIELGRQIDGQIVQEVRIYDNPALNEYVNDMGQTLAEFSHRPQIHYTVRMIEDDSINAFSTLGGFIYINIGLLRAADNEAQLASVIAHEMGHVEKRHAVQQLQQVAIAQGILAAGGLNQNEAINIGVELALHRPNSRAHELEADQVGLHLSQAAGYAPIATVDFLKKLLDQPRPPDFLSTHPNPEARITALEAQIDPATRSVGRGLNTAAYRSRIQALL